MLICLGSCKKGNHGPLPPVLTFDSTVAGNWTYTAYNIGTGGPGVWNNADPANQHAEFKGDSSFSSDVSFLKEANHYSVIDSVTIKFTPSSRPEGYFLMGFHIKTAERALYLFPVNPICIEGCTYKFVK